MVFLILLTLGIGCDIPSIPFQITSFNPEPDPQAFEFANEFLLKNTNWSIALKYDSWLRIAIEPHQADITFVILDQEYFIPSRSHFLELFTLNRGNVEIKIEYSESRDENGQDEFDCDKPFAYIAVSLRPQNQEISYDVSNYTQGPPELRGLKEAIEQVKTYKTEQLKNYATADSLQMGFNVLKSYKISVPRPSVNDKLLGKTGLWHISGSLHFDFWQHGGFLIILKSSGNPQIDWKCEKEGKCIISYHIDLNSTLLNVTITPGDYELLLIYFLKDNSEIDGAIGGPFLPYSLHITAAPLIEQEDRFNCDAARLPHQLDHLIRNDSLMFEDLVLCDLFASTNEITFKIDKESIIRIVAHEPRGIDVDIRLLNENRNLIIESLSPKGQEGILYQIASGKYIIQFNYYSSFLMQTDHKFCEKFLVQIGISTVRQIKDLSNSYGLNQCTSNIKQLGDKLQDIQKSLQQDGEFVIEVSDLPALIVPINSYQRDEEILQQFSINITEDVYIYLEIHSDFVMSDLVLGLRRKNSRTYNTIEDQQAMVSFDRKHIQGLLMKGQYVFEIQTGPTIKSATDDEPQSIYAPDLPKCAAFNIQVSIARQGENKIENWNCLDKGIQLLPATLNTVDVLGDRNAPQPVYAAFVAHNLLAPNSRRKNKEVYSTSFYLQEESIIRIRAYADSEDTLKVVLQKGANSPADKNSGFIQQKKAQGDELYIAAELAQNQRYQINIEYIPKEILECPTFSLHVFFHPNTETQNCQEKSPDQTFIMEREIGKTDISLYQFTHDTGVSSMIDEPLFTYKQSAVPHFAQIHFSVFVDAAIFTANIHTSLYENSLILELLQDEDLIEASVTENRHRIEIEPVQLTAGDYTLLIGELEPVLSKDCIEYRGSALLEDVSFWDDYRALSNKTQSCRDVEQPSDLNLVGQLEDGALHWHKLLPVDTDYRITMFSFALAQESQVRIYVDSKLNLDFTTQITIAGETSNTEIAEAAKDGQYLKKKLAPGKYFLNILYSSKTEMPKKRQCPAFEIDLEIMPQSHVDELESYFTCKNQLSFPVKLDRKSEQDVTYNISGVLQNRIRIPIESKGSIFFEVSFINTLSGFITLTLLDPSNADQVIAKSVSLQNFSQIQADVLEGEYDLLVQSCQQTASCYPVKISYKIIGKERVQLCPISQLPPMLYEGKLSPYGGAQAPDGSVNFQGTFGVPDNLQSQEILIKAPSKLLIRIMTRSQSHQLIVASTIYSDPQMSQSLAYSRQERKESSFILEIKPQKIEYMLAISFVKGPKYRPCDTYELKIATETHLDVGNRLQCEIDDDQQQFLPPNQISKFYIGFGRKSQSLNFTNRLIHKQWMIGGDTVELPKGVISKAKPNSQFMYEIQVSFATSGTFEVSFIQANTQYDYLTNDIAIDLYKDNELIKKSYWGDGSSNKYNFSSNLGPIDVESGDYVIRISQGIGPNHLAQMFRQYETCYEFTMFAEFTTEEPGMENQLRAVNPPEAEKLDVNSPLRIQLEFDLAIEESKQKLSNSIYLIEENSYGRIYPVKLNVVKDQSIIWAIFSDKALKTNQCYILQLGDLPNDGLQHKYCTGGCTCNPESEFTCSDSKCVCSYPYTGEYCYECEQGYILEQNICIQAQKPQLEMIQLRTDTIKQGQGIEMQIRFSVQPFDLDSYPLTRKNLGQLKKIIILEDGEGIQIKPTTIYPYNKAHTKWQAEWDAEDLGVGTYQTKVKNIQNIVDSNGTPFEMQSIQLPQLTVQKPDEPKECINGKLVYGQCDCEPGYAGEFCEICDQDYGRDQFGYCVILQVDEAFENPSQIDSNSRLIQVSPEGSIRIGVDQKVIQISLKFNARLYTENRQPIHRLNSVDNVAQAFVLVKAGTRKEIVGTAKYLNWSEYQLEFDATQLQLNTKYVLEMVPNILYNKQGQQFDKPQIHLPNFKVVQQLNTDLSCSNNGYVTLGACFCYEGYTGPACQMCDIGYQKNERGICKKSKSGAPITEISFENPQQSNYSQYLYLIIFSSVGGLIIYLILQFRKQQGGYRYSELDQRNQQDDPFTGINLSSNQFDRSSLPIDDDDPLF